MYTYIHTYIHTHIHAYIHTYTYACIHTYIHTGAPAISPDIVTGLSSVLTQKSAELDQYKVSTHETMAQLNKLVEDKDLENEGLRRLYKIFSVHCLRAQCRYACVYA